MIAQVKDSFLALKNSLVIRKKHKIYIDFIAFNHKVQKMIDSCTNEEQVQIALKFAWTFIFKKANNAQNWNETSAATHYELLEYHGNKKIQQLNLN